MTEVLNLTALKAVTGMAVNDLIYVKGHTTSGDGGGGIFMWRTGINYTTGGYSVDNNGTIIQATGNNTGRWVRQYDGYINVVYFGAFGKNTDYTTNIQKAIDYAKLNADNNSDQKGSTVFFPNGQYKLTNIILRHKTSILGESLEGTMLWAANIGTAGGYMFTMEAGPIFINISNFRISGFTGANSTNPTERGCFNFKAQTDGYHGGLWYSRVDNIQIIGFKGHNIYLEAGTTTEANLPNQFNTFQNVRSFKSNHFSSALRMTGQNGQTTFINCQFDGFYDNTNSSYSLGHNVYIGNNGSDGTTAVASFINCTSQDADYGFFIEGAENITLDNCWFENLGVAITAKDGPRIGGSITSKSIYVVNSRFANAAGFGSLDVPNNIKVGMCFNIANSYVKAVNNYVTVSNPAGVNANSLFLYAAITDNTGVTISDNIFADSKLSRTYGIFQDKTVSANTINCGYGRAINISSSIATINTIISQINPGELLTLKASGNITISSSISIILAGKASIALSNNDVAIFMKLDNPVGTPIETYQLVSLVQ